MADQPIKDIPVNLPTDNTANVYSATAWKLWLLLDGATQAIKPFAVTVNANANKDAVALTVVALPFALASGLVLDFGGVKATLTAAAEAGATSLAVTALSGPIAKGTPADAPGTMREVPLAAQLQPTMTNNEESIPIFGRITPIRVTNGKDFTMTVSTVAGLDDPIVSEMVDKGDMISPANRGRFILEAADGYAVLVTVNIGHKLAGQPNQSQRHEFDLNLSGKMFKTNRLVAAPVWKEIGIAG